MVHQGCVSLQILCWFSLHCTVFLLLSLEDFRIINNHHHHHHLGQYINNIFTPITISGSTSSSLLHSVKNHCHPIFCSIINILFLLTASGPARLLPVPSLCLQLTPPLQTTSASHCQIAASFVSSILSKS